MYYIYTIYAKDAAGRLRTYIGSRTAKKMAYTDAKDDFFISYFSSTTNEELRNLIESGQITHEILKEFDDPRECLIAENKMIKEFWENQGKENSWNNCYVICNKKVFSLGEDDEDAKRIRKKQGASLKQYYKDHPEIVETIKERTKQYYKDHPEALEAFKEKINNYFSDPENRKR